VDFNRGGTPLIEIVSEPDLRSADEADRYLRLLRQTIVELGVSDAEMEKGTLRADVNVSVREQGEGGYRPRWELKNMNSFTFIRRGIDAAVRQQIAAYERGETIEQSTYDYDADTDTLTVHRSKEEADDYRYFPEPDLVPVEPPAELVERLRGELPELPSARIRRLEAEVGFELAYELVSTANEPRAAALAGHGVDWRTAANVAMNEPDFLPENAAALAEVVTHRDAITREAYTAAFAAAQTRAIEAGEFLAQKAVSDEGELGVAIAAVLAANPQQVETYRGGKEGVLGFLVGQVMKETQGKADPKIVNRLLREKLQA
jgi:aspartyl-tRNA(Asn)/glutamyl-tRNA(Gln) amidotransferase subunit B